MIELADSTGVRVITADGIDTSQDNWKMHWFFKLTAATHEVDAASHRTKRGMLGQLQRGYQIAQAPFGYRAMKDMTESGKVRGTRWTIHEGQPSVRLALHRLTCAAWRRQAPVLGACALRRLRGLVLPRPRPWEGVALLPAVL